MSFFNLLLAILEKCPVLALSQLLVKPLSERRVSSISDIRIKPTNYINTAVSLTYHWSL